MFNQFIIEVNSLCQPQTCGFVKVRELLCTGNNDKCLFRCHKQKILSLISKADLFIQVVDVSDQKMLNVRDVITQELNIILKLSINIWGRQSQLINNMILRMNEWVINQIGFRMSSSNKQGNGRQMTLTQMTLANNNTSNNKPVQQQPNTTTKKNNPITTTTTTTKKPHIHQIINLQQSDSPANNNNHQQQQLQGKNEQAFVGELAKKCGAFFNWINQVDQSILGEQLWKNSMMRTVGQRFPQLNTDQQQKLIDRDWKIMSSEKKEVLDLINNYQQAILKQMLKETPYDQIYTQVNDGFEGQRNMIYLEYNDDGSGGCKEEKVVMGE